MTRMTGLDCAVMCNLINTHTHTHTHTHAEACKSWHYVRANLPMITRGYGAKINAIGTQLRDPINSGLIRWRLVVS